jgi:hypothetical protein
LLCPARAAKREEYQDQCKMISGHLKSPLT